MQNDATAGTIDFLLPALEEVFVEPFDKSRILPSRSPDSYMKDTERYTLAVRKITDVLK
jgi:hypothetical protein